MQNQFENQDEGAVAFLEAPDDSNDVQVIAVEEERASTRTGLEESCSQMSLDRFKLGEMQCPVGYIELEAGPVKVVGVNRTALIDGKAPWLVDAPVRESSGNLVRKTLIAEECIMPDGSFGVTYAGGCLDAGPGVRMVTYGRMFLKLA